MKCVASAWQGPNLHDAVRRDGSLAVRRTIARGLGSVPMQGGLEHSPTRKSTTQNGAGPDLPARRLHAVDPAVEPPNSFRRSRADGYGSRPMTDWRPAISLFPTDRWLGLACPVGRHQDSNSSMTSPLGPITCAARTTKDRWKGGFALSLIVVGPSQTPPDPSRIG